MNLLLQLVHVTRLPLAVCFLCIVRRAIGVFSQRQHSAPLAPLGSASGMVGGSTVSGFGTPHQTTTVSTRALLPPREPCTDTPTGRSAAEVKRALVCRREHLRDQSETQVGFEVFSEFVVPGRRLRAGHREEDTLLLKSAPGLAVSEAECTFLFLF